MDLQLLAPSVLIFLAIVFTAFGIYMLAREFANKRIRDRLQDVILSEEGGGTSIQSVILRDMELSSIPLFNAVLKNWGLAQRLDNLLVQGDLPIRLGSFLLLTGLLALVGLVIPLYLKYSILIALPISFCLGIIPFLYARYKKTKRIYQFEQQFPDALDMLTSALRAGLAFTGAIQVVADESPDPVAREFRILFEENRLGLDMKEALKKLAGRVDSAELRLFVTAVILQRETGGNLSEILEGTAAVIRDRFRILGDVRSMTAQARLSGLILALLPLAMAVFIMVVAPDYLKGLVADPIGKNLIIMAVVLQVVGFLIMRRIVNIRV
jgi:tight adherence protein B